MKAKVIELVGVKLDPKAKYLILMDSRQISQDAARMIGENIQELIGPNFTIGLVPDPQNAIKVFEFVPSPIPSEAQNE